MANAATIRLLLLLTMAALNLISAAAAMSQTATNPPGLSLGDFAPNLPLVFLETTNQIVAEAKVACTVQVVPPKNSQLGNPSLMPGRVRLHGASSLGLPKKSYSLTLDAATPLLDLQARADWILNAAYIDRSLMRHKLAYDLFRSLSAKSGKRCAAASRFVEVYLNGRYNGAYLLMERVDGQLLGLRAYHSNDFSHACIYKAIDHAANFSRPGHAGYEQREPEPTLKPYWAPLDELNRLVSSSPEAELFHPQTGITANLDLDNAIDFHLLVLLTSNNDGITKNFLLARNGQEQGPSSQRFFFVPWDYDGTFGRDWNAIRVSPAHWQSNNLFERLLRNAEYRAKFVARWNRLREGQFSAATVQQMIETNVQILGEAARRNATRWPTTRGGYPDRLTFEEDITQMKAWVAARIQWLDQKINQQPGKN